jgi:RimJ/RimL family protein N-acetyltransferase
VTIDATYREDAVLRDGTVARVRMVRPDDKTALAAAFEKLSPESRYRRFMTAKPRLSEAELRYLTEVDQHDHVAIGAKWRKNGVPEAIGVARYVRLADRPDTAEASVAVVDDAQGLGLGHLLLSRLVTAARERGVHRFTCEVLADNQPMRALLREIAPSASETSDGPTVRLELELDEVAVPLDALFPRQSRLYRFLRFLAGDHS